MPLKRRVLLLLSTYDPETHRAAVAAAQEYNWHLDTNLLTPLHMIDHWSGDGILCSLSDETSRTRFVEEAAVPSVDLSVWRTDIDMPRVSADNTALGRLAAEHFQAYSHRHFAWYSSTQTPFGNDRFNGFKNKLFESRHQVHRIDGPGSQHYETMVERIRKLPLPCAILTMNDADAGWLASLCLEQGYQVPMDFAILGIDNNPLVCEVHSVPLSSIDKDACRITHEGARQLQALMNGEKVSSEVTYIPPKGIVTRTSSDAFAIENDIVRSALRYMHDNISEKIGSSEVATKLGISSSYLNQNFQKVLNKPLHQTLMAMRLREAAELLSTTSWTLEMIAESTGFTHASHLSNTFKKHYGHSPKSHRIKQSFRIP